MFIDHLLSYFLGANDGTQNNNNDTNIPASDIAVEQQQQPAVNIEPTSILRSSSQPNNYSVLAAHNSSLENFVNIRARQSSDGLTSTTSSSSMNNNPPTHSVHFSDQVRPPLPAAVGNMSSQGSFQGSIQGSMPRIPSRASSEGSSSSSLASMAAALALGVSPNQVMYMQQKLQNRDQLSGIQYQLSNTSPITPVNMMGSPSGHENMMLPPPPRYPNGHPRNNLSYQQYMMQAQQQQSHIPQMVPSMNPQTVTNATQQQKPNFLPQMNPTNQQPQQQNHMNMGFPDPSSVTSSILAQPQSQPPMQQQPQQQQIQIGLNGQTIPITAVPSANGQVTYQIDPSVVPTAGLRYFTKAINEVSKPEEEKDVDPKLAAEKRAQRLARNRESARNSRRRKKELLQTLSVKVKKLQGEVETEVRAKIGSMEDGLVQQRKEMMEQWLTEQGKNEEGDDESSRNQLKAVLQKTGVNCQIRRAVIAHQYNILRQTFLSPHNHFSVWMMMKSATFFTEASRRQQAKIASGDVMASANKTPSTRANSKHIGEDIYNEQKKRQGSVSCNANDELQTWPLYCYEITMTMEQEDRIINQAHAT